MSRAVIVLTTVPTEALGEEIASLLVKESLAACVNIGAPMTSMYRWKGEIERETERQLTIKTTPDRVRALEARIKTLHSYEVPEFLVIDVADGSEAYLQWLRDAIAETPNS